MDISIYQGASSIVINGAGISSPFKAARFTNSTLLTLEVAMEGSAGSIASAVSTLAAALSEADRVNGQPGEEWVYIKVTLPDGVAWRSLLSGGSLQAVHNPAGRKLSADTISLQLFRAPWWEADSIQAITLSNQHGTGASVTIYNHDDGAHDNHATLGAISGDLPAPLLVSMEEASLANCEAFLGISAFSGAFTQIYEGETAASGGGVTVAVTADAACSNGQYNALSWAGSTAKTPAFWTVSQPQASAFGGRFFRPLLRFRSLIAGGEKIWVYIRLAYDSGGAYENVYQTDPFLLPLDSLLVALPAIQLPPWPTLNADSHALTLMLTAWGEGAGTHNFPLDFLGFLPMDSYLHLIPQILTYPDFNILYDSEKRLVKNNNRSMGTHIPEGDGLWVYPGRTNNLHLLTRSGVAMSIATAFSVSLSYRPRRRAL